MIKNLIFDLGGVLINGDDEIFFRNTTKVEKLLKTSRNQLIKNWSRNWSKFRIGKMTEDQFMKTYAELSSEDDKENIVKKLKEIWRFEVKAMPALKYIDNLKKEYYIYGLSNISKEWLEFKTEKLELKDKFIKIYNSAEEGVAKPNLKIYKHMLAKAGINPEESIFVDDSERNTGAAKRIGLKTIHFKTEDQFREKLLEFEIVLDKSK